MAELFQVLGAILRDLAHSRALSDIFSRDVSIEYEDDPRLRAFPVPRVEIKEATVNLAFAINKMQPKPVDTSVVVKPNLRAYGTLVSEQIFNRLVLGHDEKDRVLAVIDQRQPKLKEELSRKLEDTFAESEEELKFALEDRPQDLEKKIHEASRDVLFKDDTVKTALSLRSTAAAFSRKLRLTGADIIKTRVVKDARDKIEKVQKESLGIEVALTKDELAEVSETVVSNITVITEVRNYEWTQVDEEDGEPVRRLVRE